MIRASHHQSTAEVTVESRLKYLEQSLEDRHVILGCQGSWVQNWPKPPGVELWTWKD